MRRHLVWLRNMGCIIVWIGLILANGATVRADESVPAQNRFSFGITEAAFTGLNLNDSTVALKAWAVALAKEQKLDVKIEMMVYPNFKELQQDFSSNRLDAANLSTIEFLALDIRPDHIFLPATEEGVYLRYCLVVRAKNQIQKITHLMQKTLVTYDGPDMALARPWLQTVLADENRGRTSAELDDFLAKSPRVDSPSKAILQVFFGQADAALLTLDAYDTACILNPQLRNELRVVYQSQPLIVDCFIFNPAFRKPLRDELEAAIEVMDDTTKGRQVLTIFRCSRLVRTPVETLESTRALLVRYETLCNQEEDRGKGP